MEGKMEFEEFEEKYQTLTTEEQEKVAIELVKSVLQDKDQVNSTVFSKMVDIHLLDGSTWKMVLRKHSISHKCQ